MLEQLQESRRPQALPAGQAAAQPPLRLSLAHQLRVTEVRVCTDMLISSRKPLRRQADLRQPLLRFRDQLARDPFSACQSGGQGISSRQHRHLCVAVSYPFRSSQSLKLTTHSDTAKVPTVDTYLADIKAKNAAGASPPIIGAFVVYDFPNRDCAALASNGEYTIANDGVNKYKAYIDSIAAILKKYPDVPVSRVIGKPLSSPTARPQVSEQKPMRKDPLQLSTCESRDAWIRTPCSRQFQVQDHDSRTTADEYFQLVPQVPYSTEVEAKVRFPRKLNWRGLSGLFCD